MKILARTMLLKWVPKTISTKVENKPVEKVTPSAKATGYRYLCDYHLPQKETEKVKVVFNI